MSKIRDIDEKVAADFCQYIDDIRASGATYEECWQAARRVASVLQYLGLQDAARKVRPPVQDGSTWAGSVVATHSSEVAKLVTEKRWAKTRTIIRKWVQAHRESPELDAPALRSDRGFLVYISRTYPWMVPYL